MGRLFLKLKTTNAQKSYFCNRGEAKYVRLKNTADNDIMSRSTPISPDFLAYLVAAEPDLAVHNILVCGTFQALSWLNLLKALAHILCGRTVCMQRCKLYLVPAPPPRTHSHKKGFAVVVTLWLS